MQNLAATEFEFEGEDELEFEGEFEGEQFLGGLTQMLGLGEGELEGEWEAEGEWEFETDGEEFLNFRKIARGIGGFIRKAAPVLRQVAKVAAPMVGTAVGGPLGGMLGKAASSLLEGEYEDEFEQAYAQEFEYEGEFELEDEYEGEFELETPANPAAELMAAVAAQAQTEAEAEAMAGAATLLAISPSDRAELRRVLPHMVRGTAILTRILRSRRGTRPAVRIVPTIVRRTSTTLTRQAAAGQPVTKKTAARVMANQTRKVLTSPRTCAKAMQNNVTATRVASRQGSARARRPAIR
jgi:hypothetical protein